jgi:hypothetical protein
MEIGRQKQVDGRLKKYTGIGILGMPKAIPWRKLKAQGIFPGRKKKERPWYEPRVYYEGPKTWKHLTWAERKTLVNLELGGVSVGEIMCRFGVTRKSVEKIIWIYYNEADVWDENTT